MAYADQDSLDTAWCAVWPAVAARDLPIIAGGRSAGSQVAVRTAAGLDAVAVLVLAYPLLGPGSPRELLDVGLPTLIVQGTRDPFGTPRQFPPLPATVAMAEIADGDHMFATPSGYHRSLNDLTTAVTKWIVTVVDAESTAPPSATP
jgi:hypothetical protein